MDTRRSERMKPVPIIAISRADRAGSAQVEWPVGRREAARRRRRSSRGTCASVSGRASLRSRRLEPRAARRSRSRARRWKTSRRRAAAPRCSVRARLPRRSRPSTSRARLAEAYRPRRAGRPGRGAGGSGRRSRAMERAESAEAGRRRAARFPDERIRQARRGRSRPGLPRSSSESPTCVARILAAVPHAQAVRTRSSRNSCDEHRQAEDRRVVPG